MIASERVTTDGETTRRVWARYSFDAALRVERQSLSANPAVPVVAQTRTAFEGHVHVDAGVGVFASDSAGASAIGVLEDFKDLPFVFAQGEIRRSARIEIFDTDAVKATDDCRFKGRTVTNERCHGVLL